jgi:hypothetical protein
MSCLNIATNELLNEYNKLTSLNDQIAFGECVANLSQTNADYEQLFNIYTINTKNYENVSELNNSSMNLYINDYWYIIVKAIVYSIVLVVFVYFYGIRNLIEHIKTSATTITEKTLSVKDKLVEMKDKVVEVKEQIK